jgi:DNA-binding MarR family transcriptional regulator
LCGRVEQLAVTRFRTGEAGLEVVVRKLGAAVAQRLSATEARKREWILAMRWRRRAEAALSQAGLTLTQWIVLDALRELIAETEDAVSQNEVCDRVELDRSTISSVMRRLE